MKSGKKSCCARGGSWFRDCGSPKNKKRGHTWFEGIQACQTNRAQLKTLRGQQSNAAQQPNSADDIGTANSRAVVTAAQTPNASDIESTEYDTGKANSKSIATAASTIVSRLMTTTTIAAAITTTTTIAQTAKEALIATDWILQVVLGTTFTSIFLL